MKKIEEKKTKIEKELNELSTIFKKRFPNYDILAINYRNSFNNLTWHLFDFNYIEQFRNKQPILRIGNITLKADDYEYGTSLVYEANRDKKYVLVPEKQKLLKSKNIAFDTLATRARLPSFGGIWKILDEEFASKYSDQLFGIKINNHLHLSHQYEKKTLIVKNKLTNEKTLMTIRGKIPMKIK